MPIKIYQLIVIVSDFQLPRLPHAYPYWDNLVFPNLHTYRYWPRRCLISVILQELVIQHNLIIFKIYFYTFFLHKFTSEIFVGVIMMFKDNDKQIHLNNCSYPKIHADINWILKKNVWFNSYYYTFTYSFVFFFYFNLFILYFNLFLHIYSIFDAATEKKW